MYKFCTLFSGSSGNSTYIGNSNEGILIDIGKNAKQTILALSKLNLTPDCVKAIFITHEHIDHVSGLRVFCSKYNIPVFASGGTLNALDLSGHLKGKFPVFQISDYADVGDFHIEAFHTMHDSAESMGFTIFLPNGTRTSVATDLGVVTPEVEENILGSKVVLLESNHDVNMLSNGPYPYHLKRRILSETGHLCNDAAAKTAVKLVNSGTEHIVLGHLSSENNVPELAFETVAAELKFSGASLHEDYMLTVASRHEPIVAEVL